MMIIIRGSFFELSLKSFLAFFFCKFLKNYFFTRVLYERVLSEDMNGDKMEAVWNKYLEFECNVGDLTSMMKVRFLTYSGPLRNACFRIRS